MDQAMLAGLGNIYCDESLHRARIHPLASAINLPDASVAIQVSGTFGSRQEEAQRLGRVLRPKGDRNVSYFYSLISKDSTEQEFARNRQLFLTEQGYSYSILDAADVVGQPEPLAAEPAVR